MRTRHGTRMTLLRFLDFFSRFVRGSKPQDRLQAKFKVGDRVRVSEKYHWAKGAFGTIAAPTAFFESLPAMKKESWHGCWRSVQGREIVFTFYWVVFDKAHDDGSGDGSYSQAEIDADYVEHAEKHNAA